MRPEIFSYLESKEKVEISLIKILYPYFKQHKIRFIIASVFLTISSMLAIFIPYLSKIAIDDALIQNKNVKLLTYLVILMAIIHITRSIFSGTTQYLFTKLNQEIMVSIKKDVFKKIMKLPFSFYDKVKSGYILSRIAEIEGLSFFFSPNLINQLIRILEFFFALFMMLYLNWKLTLIILIILPLYYLMLKPLSTGMVNITQNLLESSARLAGNLQERISGFEVIKTFGKEEKEVKNIEEAFKNISQKNLIQSIFFTIFAEFNITLTALIGLLVLWKGGMDIINGRFTLGGYIAFISYLQRLYSPIQSFAVFNLTFYPSLVSLKRLNEILSLSEEEDLGEIYFDTVKEKIEFQNIYFSYDGKNNILEDFNIEIKKGEKLIIQGPNGSGKSTIIRLLLRMYEPIQGKIFIDNIDIKKYKLSSIREKIGIVSQNIFLFDDTIRNNILYANPQASDMDIIQVLKDMELFDFFMEEFSEGLDTIIGERGLRVSGGQRKIIAFLRALLKKPEILILDEATSEIDMRIEKQIFRYINEKLKDKICIVITPKDIENINWRKIYIENGRVKNS